MDKPAYLVDRDSSEEADLLKAAYAHDHEPIPFKQHQAVQEEMRFESLMWKSVPGWLIDVQIVDGHPNKFFLTAKRSGEREPTMATKGFWFKVKQAVDSIGEFAKALAAMLVILAPMLLRGGGL